MIEITGRLFGRLTPLRPTEKRDNGSVVWFCECECGNTALVPRPRLLNGGTRSCGCLRAEKSAENVRASNLKRANKYRIDGDVVRMKLLTRANIVIGIVKFDLIDLDIVRKYHWFNCGGYVAAKTDSTNTSSNIYMHRLLFDDGAEFPHVDHINNDKFDNRRINLRGATASQNFQNQTKRQTYGGKPTTSRYKGVSYNKVIRMWTAQLNGQRLGKYNTEEEAASVYNKEALEKFGEFANINVFD